MATNMPFFSRRQLNLIIAICAVVIALLSIPTDSWPLIERQQRQQVEVTAIAEPAGSSQPSALQLRLIFALPKPSLQPKPAAQILHQLLQARLTAAADLSANLRPDRLTLQIALSNNTTSQLQPIANLLQQPFAATTVEQAIKRWRAQRYIGRNQRSAEAMALEAIDQQLRHPSLSSEEQAAIPFDADLSVAVINQLQRQLFHPRQLRISLIGREIDAISNEISALASQLDQQQPAINQAIDPADAIRPAQTPHINAVYQTLTGRQQADFATTLLLSRILQQLNPTDKVRLYPSATASQLLWLPQHSVTTTEPKQPQTSDSWLTEAIEQSLQQLAAIKDWELERFADQLREQLENRLQQPDTLADQLEVIAFYRLPVDYLPQFDATIAALDGAQLRQQLLQLLQPQRFRQISAAQ